MFSPFVFRVAESLCLHLICRLGLVTTGFVFWPALLATCSVYAAPKISVVPLELPSVRQISVSDEGTVAFSSDEALYSWNSASGLSKLESVQRGRGVTPFISRDGQVLAYAPILDTDISGSVVYQSGARSFIHNHEFRLVMGLSIGALSPDGMKLSGSVGDQGAAIYHLTSGITEIVSEGLGLKLTYTKSLASSGHSVSMGPFRPFNEGFFPLPYVSSLQASPSKVEHLSTIAMISADGTHLLGNAASCDNSSQTHCVRVMNLASDSYVEVGHFKASSISASGHIVTGESYQPDVGSLLWRQGEEIIAVSELMTSESDQGQVWTSFARFVVSPNGRYIAGLGKTSTETFLPLVIELEDLSDGAVTVVPETDPSQAPSGAVSDVQPPLSVPQDETAPDDSPFPVNDNALSKDQDTGSHGQTVGPKSVVLSWERPLRLDNGDVLDPKWIKAYRVYRGADPGSLSLFKVINDPSLRHFSHQVGKGTYYYAMSTVTFLQGEGPLSEAISLHIEE